MKFLIIRFFFEPAEGNGAITKVLRKKFDNVYSNDISYYEDFLQYPEAFYNDYKKQSMDYIITNPPYSKLDLFIKKAKQVATEKFAFLCKITHLGGVERFKSELFRDPDYPLTKIYMFTRQANLRFYDQQKALKQLEDQIKTNIYKYQKDREHILKQTHYPELREDGKYPAGMYYYCWLIWEKQYYEGNYVNPDPVFKWINNQQYILSKKDL